jgi:hypothetical protein
MTTRPLIAEVQEYETAFRDQMAGLVASARITQHPVTALCLEGLNVKDPSEVLGELEHLLKNTNSRYRQDVVIYHGPLTAVFFQCDREYAKQWLAMLDDQLLQRRCIVAAEAAVTYDPATREVPGRTYGEQAQALTQQLQQSFQKDRAFKARMLAKQKQDFALLNLQAALY